MNAYHRHDRRPEPAWPEPPPDREVVSTRCYFPDPAACDRDVQTLVVFDTDDPTQWLETDSFVPLCRVL